MSKENALAFLERISHEKELQKKASGPNSEPWGALARSAGFDCTDEELESASRSIIAASIGSSSKTELSDEDLDSVAGGLSFSSTSFAFGSRSFDLKSLSNLSSFRVLAW